MEQCTGSLGSTGHWAHPRGSGRWSRKRSQESQVKEKYRKLGLGGRPAKAQRTGHSDRANGVGTKKVEQKDEATNPMK